MTKLAALLRTCFFVTLVICCTRSNARSQQQKVTINAEAKTLSAIFKEIKRQTGLVVFYSDALINDKEKISLNVKEEMLSTLLDRIIAGRPLRYEIQEKYIVISAKPAQPEKKSEQLAAGLTAAPPTVHGRITNEKGEPVAGVNISLKGGKVIGVTNDNGEFTLTNIPDNAILVFSAVNVEAREVQLSNRGINPLDKDLNLSVKSKVSVLDEVQIIAYGQTSKRLQTGNVTTVKGEDIAKQPVSNPLLALEGRVPGLFITQNSGVTGGGVTVRVQGQNSILSGNDPLYVIDGVPYLSSLPRSGLDQVLVGGANEANTPSPFNYINPNDIESISILKDADATAIYGSRAANGAILITTKKGQIGQTKLDINVREGWGKVSRKLAVLNTDQYIQMRLEGKRNDNESILNTDYDINGLWGNDRYTDWQKKLIGGTSCYTDINGSISGGSLGIQYLIGGTYHKETTVFPTDLADQKGSLHFNINSTSSNQKFRFQFSGNYLVDNNKLPAIDLTQSAIQLEPNAPDLYKSDGTLNWMPNNLGTSTWNNPFVSIVYSNYSSKTSNLIGNSVISYDVSPVFQLRSSFGYANTLINDFSFTPLNAIKPENRATTARSALYGNRNLNSWIIEPQMAFKKNIGEGKLDILLGFTIQQNVTNVLTQNGSGYNSDLVLNDIKSAASSSVVNSTIASYKYNAVFGRLNYVLQNKYVADLTVRRDGSSRFGSQNQFHNFGSIATAWIFSQEDFIKKNLSFLSFGKLKGSYGSTGNDQIGDYSFLSLYNTTNLGVGVPYQSYVGLAPNSLSNQYLQWEETRKLQFGVDLGFLEDRILASAAYALNRSSNQLLQYALPGITGFTSITDNFPATIENTSWEFSLSSTNLKSQTFTWLSNFNLTIPNNKLVEFPNLSNSTYSSLLVIGEPVTVSKAYHFLGVDPATGKYLVADKNGNATSSPNSIIDKTALINTLPRYYGGFQNSISYKKMHLDFLFQFVSQIGRVVNFNNGTAVGPGAFISGGGNQPLLVLNRWQKPGDITDIQKFRSNLASSLSQINMVQSSDAAYSDASYIRLKNISLSWELPLKAQKTMHFRNCNIYIQGQNLLTLTNYKGLDPENKSISSLPPLRMMIIGVSVGL